MAEKQKKDNFFKKVASYAKAVKSEVKKVTWPSRKQVIHNTGIVIVCIAIVGVIIFALDAFFGFSFGFLSNEKAGSDVVEATDFYAELDATDYELSLENLELETETVEVE